MAKFASTNFSVVWNRLSIGFCGQSVCDGSRAARAQHRARGWEQFQ